MQDFYFLVHKASGLRSGPFVTESAARHADGFTHSFERYSVERVLADNCPPLESFPEDFNPFAYEPAPDPLPAALSAGLGAVEKALETPIDQAAGELPKWLASRATHEGFTYHQIDEILSFDAIRDRALRGLTYPKTICDTSNRDMDISPEEDATNARMIVTAPETAKQRDELADALEAILRDTWSADDTRLLAVSLFGSKVDADMHARCDRLKAAHAAGREALQKAGRS